MTWVKVSGLAVFLGLIFGLGWTVNGWRLSSKLSKERAQATQREAALALEVEAAKATAASSQDAARQCNEATGAMEAAAALNASRVKAREARDAERIRGLEATLAGITGTPPPADPAEAILEGARRLAAMEAATP